VKKGAPGWKRCGCWLPSRNQGKPAFPWLDN
jgi:hypothetical protein